MNISIRYGACFLIAGLGLACGEDEGQLALTEQSEIIENLISAGFPASEIHTTDEGEVFVGSDALVSLDASREMAYVADDSEVGTKEQYRTNNLVGANIGTICIRPNSAFSNNEQLSRGLRRAVRRYNRLRLSFRFRINGSGCNATISAVTQSGGGGVAGFPSGGRPFNRITIGNTLTGDVATHVIMHELGHTIGFRHTDYFDRSISCGQGGGERVNPDGAVHIAGTPTGAVRDGSVMNACYNSGSNGQWTSSDRTALNALYGN